MDDFLELFDAARLNLIEAGFWIALGLIAMLWRRTSPEQRRMGRFIGIWLIVFGVSDLIEMRTGAWYRPWWLLVLKGLCLVMLALGAFWHYSQRSSRPGNGDSPPL